MVLVPDFHTSVPYSMLPKVYEVFVVSESTILWTNTNSSTSYCCTLSLYPQPTNLLIECESLAGPEFQTTLKRPFNYGSLFADISPFVMQVYISKSLSTNISQEAIDVTNPSSMCCSCSIWDNWGTFLH